MGGKQGTLKNIVPPLTLRQELARDWFDKKEKAKKANEVAKQAEEDMVRAAQKAGEDVIKFHDSHDKLRIVQLDNKITIKTVTLTDKKIEKLEKDAAASAGAGGPKK